VRITVTGAGGMLGRAVVREARARGLDVTALDRSACDVTDAVAVNDCIARVEPDVIVHCAAYTRVDDAEAEPDAAHLVNAQATQHVARAAAGCGALLIYPSTDYVFNGAASEPYPPDAPTSPINEYGRSKLAGEAAAAQARRHLIVRTSWLYGADGRNFVTTMIDRARAGDAVRVVDDQRGAPTCTRDLARMMLTLAEADAPAGIYHATNAGDTTWYGFAQHIFAEAGIDVPMEPTTSSAFSRPARRPAYSVLDCAKTYTITGSAPHWREALHAALPTLL
jgi:dTDP-4-dehydrorhamnose reductase